MNDMDQQQSNKGVRSMRPRRQHHRRAPYGEDRRPPKRLFTPEIKRFLKDWLVRRRDNPYPNRDEKKSLAVQTGLTYVQVCNWFANWRRKLKNAGREPQRMSWGNLIRRYNSQAHGNVEHFSISSDDSIWQETQDADTSAVDHCYTNVEEDEEEERLLEENSSRLPIDKYLPEPDNNGALTKWLQSAANFQPRRNYWCAEWRRLSSDNGKPAIAKRRSRNGHAREELDAAEALTRLAGLAT